jgi:hypothetical protein
MEMVVTSGTLTASKMAVSFLLQLTTHPMQHKSTFKKVQLLLARTELGVSAFLQCFHVARFLDPIWLLQHGIDERTRNPVVKILHAGSRVEACKGEQLLSQARATPPVQAQS